MTSIYNRHTTEFYILLPTIKIPSNPRKWHQDTFQCQEIHPENNKEYQ